MKRNWDLIRDILLYTEANSPGVSEIRVGPSNFEGLKDHQELAAHIRMLLERNLLDGGGDYSSGWSFWEEGDDDNFISLGNLTWDGHEFLDKIRSPKIWKKTKKVAQKTGGFTLGLLGDIASGLIKTQVEKYTGVEI